jgi:hypothetical protein
VPSVEAAAATDAAAAQATDPHRAHGPVHTHCENCGTALQGPFCHHCGQHDFDAHRSFGHTFLEALENFFHFDAKFFRNIVTLLFRPGVLTAEFNAGKRAAQMPPFRLYLFTAFFFFLIEFSGAEKSLPIQASLPANTPPAPLAVNGRQVAPGQATDAAEPSHERTVDRVRHAAEKIRDDAKAARAAEKKPNQPHITFVPVDKPEPDKTTLERWFERQTSRANEPEFQRELGHTFLVAIPKLLLLSLPLFALYTRVLFRRGSGFYLQHLVLALHFHTFLFLWLLVRDGWSFLLSFPSASLGNFAKLAAAAWLILYPVLMFRRLTGEGWIRTLVKTFTLFLGYVFTLAVVFFVGLVAFVLLL